MTVVRPTEETHGNAVGRVDADGRVTWYDPIPEGGALLFARPAGFPECSGCRDSCPENEGYGCCREEMAAALGAAAAAPSQDAEDAARYRWLRERAEPNRGGEKPWCTVRDKKGYAWALGPSLDAAIDAARAAQAQGGEA